MLKLLVLSAAIFSTSTFAMTCHMNDQTTYVIEPDTENSILLNDVSFEVIHAEDHKSSTGTIEETYLRGTNGDVGIIIVTSSEDGKYHRTELSVVHNKIMSVGICE